MVEFECVNRVFQLYAERFFGIQPPRDPNQMLGEVAVDAPITRCVGIGQSVTGYIAADTEMIKLDGSKPGRSAAFLIPLGWMDSEQKHGAARLFRFR